MFLIGEFSKISKVSKRLLHHYDEVGLFSPIRVDESTGYRYYSATQLPKLNKILVLKELGFSLNEIVKLISEDIADEEIQGMLTLKKSEVENTLIQEQIKLRRLEARLKVNAQKTFSPDVIVKPTSEAHYLSLRHVYADEQELALIAGKVFAAVPTIVPKNTLSHYCALLHSSEFNASEMDIEVGFMLTGKLENDIPLDNLQLKRSVLAPYSKAATIVMQGSTDPVLEGLEFIASWIEKNNYRIVAPIREIVLEVPSNGNLFEAVVEIQAPILEAS